MFDRAGKSSNFTTDEWEIKQSCCPRASLSFYVLKRSWLGQWSKRKNAESKNVGERKRSKGKWGGTSFRHVLKQEDTERAGFVNYAHWGNSREKFSSSSISIAVKGCNLQAIPKELLRLKTLGISRNINNIKNALNINVHVNKKKKTECDMEWVECK